MPSEKTKRQALTALDNMRSIVHNEMLIAGSYIDDEITNEELAAEGAVCGGRKHCAIGSLWVAAGVRYTKTEWPLYGGGVRVTLDLPGVTEPEREDFLRHRPALKLAYDCINASAKAYAEKKGLPFRPEDPWLETFDAAVEALFEGNWDEGRIDKKDLLKVISGAKRRVKAA